VRGPTSLAAEGEGREKRAPLEIFFLKKGPTGDIDDGIEDAWVREKVV
jgi:hypothetical protein